MSPPDKKGRAPAKSTPEEKKRWLQLIDKPGVFKPLLGGGVFAGPCAMAMAESGEAEEPNIVVFGHLHRATRVILCRTTKEARALWRILPKPTTAAVVALPDPQDLNALIISKTNN